MHFHLVFIFLSLLFISSNCANVLLIFPMASKSHSILGHALGHGLVKKGHNVTMVSPFPQNKQIPNYHDIALTKVFDAWTVMMNAVGCRTKVNQQYALLFKMFTNAAILTEITIQEEAIQKILQSDTKYEVIIISPFFNDALFAIGHHFNAPVIVFATTGPSFVTNSLVGNPSPYAYVPDVFLTYSDHMTFIQRLINMSVQVVMNIIKYFTHYSAQDEILKKYFPKAPTSYEIHKQVALVLTNSHRSLEYSRPLVPNIIEVGGLQVSKPNPLPKDLQEFMDDAPHGVIYFSLGTNIRSEDMPTEMKNSFVEVFAKLKQKILWKCDEPTIEGLSKNVRLSKWYPQSDVLAHPNIKLFITHGGLLSTTETAVRGVPCLGIPIFGDQQKNMQTSERIGFAVTLEFTNVTTKSLTWALNEVLSNPKYTSEAKKLSLLLSDNLVHPLDKAVYWVEYVIRHKGAPHLRSAGADLPLYQYLLLDVVGFILIILISVFTLIYFIVKKFINFVKNRFVRKKSEKNKKD